MIIAIHDQNVTLQGVTFEMSPGVFVEIDSGTSQDAHAQYAAYLYSEATAKALAQIASLESTQIKQMARFNRERDLKEAEDLALQQFGLTPDQLYAVGASEGAPTAALNYKKLKDLDNAIKVEREKIG
jgi:hypothetical protein